MSTLINASIRVDKLPKEKFVKGKVDKNGDTPVYYNFTISVQDSTTYGNNVWVTDSQTKEEREAKMKKLSLGNGKVVWTDGNVVLAEREDNQMTSNEPAQVAETSDLPF